MTAVDSTSSASASSAAPAAEAGPGLVYVSDVEPGYTRVRRGKQFVYRDPKGRTLRDAAQLERIRRLAIPPAYEAVWICTLPDGHLQATGRDARGRKQYRYHARWRELRDQAKFERLLAFGRALARIRARVLRDLRGPSQRLSRPLVLAAIVRLLDTTFVRVGNDAYAKANRSYGLSTLRARHVTLGRGVAQLRFRGKGGIAHDVVVDDPRVVRIVRRCQALPGRALFQYIDDEGARHTIGSADVNDYLAEAAGERYTAKDFRTWHGSVQALDHAQAIAADAPLGKAAVTRAVARLVEQVAHDLGNTPAVCRKAYIHPQILQFAAERLGGFGPARRGRSARPLPQGPAAPGIKAAERRLIAFLARLPG